jgi:hypothetical protein
MIEMDLVISELSKPFETRPHALFLSAFCYFTLCQEHRQHVWTYNSEGCCTPMQGANLPAVNKFLICVR